MEMNRPAWGTEAKRVMLERDINMTELAKSVGLARSYCSANINGLVISPRAKARICAYLGIELAS